MDKLSVLLCIGLIVSLMTSCHASKILVVTANFKSHVMYMGSMGKALASEGHDVTMVAGDTMPIMPEFQTEDLKWLKYKLEGKPFAEIPGNMPSGDNVKLTSFEGVKTLMNALENLKMEHLRMYEDKEFMRQVEEMKFDFAVVDSPMKANLILPYRLGIPYASLAIDFDSSATRMPKVSSYVPVMLTGYSDRMSFRQRLVNVVAGGLQEVVFSLLFATGGSEDTAKYAPEKGPVTYHKLQQGASLFFTLRAPGLHYVRGSLPNMFDLGGIMFRPANLSNIQPELRAVVDSATQGFIMVSFGSWMSAPEETVQKFIDAFASTNLMIIWKQNDPPKNLPPNVKTVSWLPQNDLLGHPNIRAFITHCGGSSMLETLHHGVPVIAVPLGVDQQANAGLLVSRNLGVLIDIKDFEVPELVSAMENVTNPENGFAGRMARVSVASNAMPDAARTASFWIEHVIQHGGQHLRAAAFDLEDYEYHNIDVFAFLVATLVVVWYVVKLCGRCMRRSVCKRKPKQD